MHVQDRIEKIAEAVQNNVHNQHAHENALVRWQNLLDEPITSFQHYLTLLKIWKERLPTKPIYYPGFMQRGEFPKFLKIYTDAELPSLVSIVTETGGFKRSGGDQQIVMYERKGMRLAGSHYAKGCKKYSLPQAVAVKGNRIAYQMAVYDEEDNDASFVLLTSKGREELKKPENSFDYNAAFSFRTTHLHYTEQKLKQIAVTTERLLGKILEEKIRAIFEIRFKDEGFGVSNFKDLEEKDKEQKK